MKDKKTNLALKIDFNLGEMAGKDLVLNDKVEAEIVKLIQAKAAIDNLLEAIENLLESQMSTENITLIERNDIKITRKTVGKKFALDPKEAVDSKFTKLINYPIVKSEEVEKYMAEKGSLPTGIIDNARQQKVKIELLENSDDKEVN